MDLTTTCEVVVVGGGPAGSTAAALLAAWGHDVVLVTGRPRANPLAETLPPSARNVLRLTGQLDAIERGAFMPARGTTVRWGGRSDSTRFGTEPGWQMRRDRLDALLLEGAEKMGARIHRDAAAHEAHPADGVTPARVYVMGPGSRGAVAARWIVDASGRAGLLAARAGRCDTGEPTLSVAQLWRREGGWQLDDPTDTVVESYEGGWVWSIPSSDGVRCVGAMVDKEPASMGRDAATRHRAELERTELHRRLLEGATPLGPGWACAATSYASSRYAEPGWLVVGDAGSFLDPLSSYGVKKALASAWLGAVAVHTALVRPEMTDAAVELHDAREREAATHYERATAHFHAEATKAHPGRFWSARAARSPTAHADGAPDALAPDGGAVLADPAVRRAFAELKASETIRLRPTARVGRVRSPAVRGVEIVLEDRVTSPAAPGGLGLLRGVDLPALVDAAREPGDVPELFEAYARKRGPVALPDFLAGLSVLLANGMLENEALLENEA